MYSGKCYSQINCSRLEFSYSKTPILFVKIWWAVLWLTSRWRYCVYKSDADFLHIKKRVSKSDRGRKKAVLVSQPHVERLCRYHTYIIESLHKHWKWSKNWLRGPALSWSVPWIQFRRFGKKGCSLNWHQTCTSSPMWQWEHRAALSSWYTHSTRSPTAVCSRWPRSDFLKWTHSGPEVYILMPCFFKSYL